MVLHQCLLIRQEAILQVHLYLALPARHHVILRLKVQHNHVEEIVQMHAQHVRLRVEVNVQVVTTVVEHLVDLAHVVVSVRLIV